MLAVLKVKQSLIVQIKVMTQEQNKIILAASISLHLGGTSKEQLIQQRVASPVRSGLTLTHGSMTSLMLVITITAGILLGVTRIKSGASPTTML